MTPIKLHDLRPAKGEKKARTRVGRGEGSKGKTAGRGTKGTGARKNVPVGFEGGQMPIHMRLPKLKGFKNPNKVVFAVINVARREAAFEAGDVVTRDVLVQRGLVKKKGPVKVLGQGDLSKALTIDVEAVSSIAREKIEAAGGSVR